MHEKDLQPQKHKHTRPRKERKRYERNGGVKMNHELKEHSCPNKYSLNICYKLFLI